MKTYELPGDVSFMEPAEARAALKKLKAEIVADRDHPLLAENHFQHEAALRVFEELNSMVRRGEAGADHEAEAAFLADALSDEAPCATPEECRKRAADLLKTPGYVTHERGESVLTDGEREKIRRKIHALHIVAEAGGAGQADADDDGADDDDGDDDAL